MRRPLIAGAAAGVVATGGLAFAVNAAATTTTGACHGAKIRDVIAKKDVGHGAPAEWAYLKLFRTVTVKCTAPGVYEITLKDKGVLVTIKGAGTPNGTGGTIAHTVPGTVNGTYNLTATGKLDVPAHRDTTLGSTAYVQSLFPKDSVVTGKDYSWKYVTCGGAEHWEDASSNDDGKGAGAGNITGKIFPRCLKHHPTKPPVTPTPTTPTPTGSASPTTPPGEAPAPTPVPSDLPVTG